MNAAQSQAIDALFATAPGAPGHVWALLRQGRVVHQGASGLASLELGTPLTPQSRLRVASVSKQFTVAAVLQLKEAGRLRLDDDVRALLPELPRLPQRISVEQLMRNCSGLPDMLELLRLGGVGLEAWTRRSELLAALLRNKHLNFAPGSRFLYSNSNFLLLGLIVERLSGVSLADYLQAEIFAPLQMKDTALVLAADAVCAGLASPYLDDGQGGWRRALHGFEHGGEGGLVSNCSDLSRWAQLLLAPPPAWQTIVAQLTDAQPLSGGQRNPYACGLEIGEFCTHRSWSHGGLWPGYKTEFLVLPEEQLAAVVISNSGSSQPYRLAREMCALALGQSWLTTLDAAAGAEADSLQGEWLDATAGQLLQLRRQGSRLLAQQWGASFELRREADGSWRALRGVYPFELRREAQGLRLDMGSGLSALLQRHAPEQDLTLPPQLAGRYACPHLEANWLIRPDGLVILQGPLATAPRPGRLRALTTELLELQTDNHWGPATQLLRLQREADGRIAGLLLDSSRIKQMPFQRSA